MKSMTVPMARQPCISYKFTMFQTRVFEVYGGFFVQFCEVG
jgi:hypothetical protein